MARWICVVVLLVWSGVAVAGTKIVVTATDTPSTVEIVVYDGTMLPATTVAGCSAYCLGYVGPVTGTVTHPKNYVGWGVGSAQGTITFLVDGKKSDSVMTSNPKLLLWNTQSATAGPHTLLATTDNPKGTSTPLTITVVK